MLRDPAPSALLWEFGGSALNFRVHFWVSDYSTERRRATKYGARSTTSCTPQHRDPLADPVEYSRGAAADTPERRESFTRAIAAVPVFAGLPEDAHRALAAAATPRLFGKGEVIVREADGGGSMFLLLRGRVAILVGDPPKQVATTEAGGYFGEMSLLTGDPRTATVSGSTRTSQPMRASTSSRPRSPWAELEPSRGTTTRPPVTAAAAKKYEAPEASGSTAYTRPW